MRKWAFVFLLTLFTSLQISSQDNIVLRYDFSSVSGTTVRDLSASGADASLAGGATVEAMGKYSVLNLGNSTGHLNMTATAGKAFAAQDDYTLSVYYRVDAEASLSGNGYFLWSFSTSAACGATSGIYSAYRLNAQRIASSTGGYQNESGYSVDAPSARAKWIHVAYSQQGNTGKLYVDGVLKGTMADMPKNSTLFAASKPLYCWLGRAPFSGDSFLKQTLVTDFCLYSEALSAEQVNELADKTSDLEYEYKYGTPGDFTTLATALGECKTFLSSAVAEDYAPNALTELQDIVTIAQEEYNAGKIAQAVIDSRVESLQNTLKQAQDSRGFALHAPTHFEAGTQGFRHPGGLHTDQDFARIKKALADGDTNITQAWQKLCANEYAQASIATWPVETIFRGGTGTQNYMNVARGAAMAYQNALRWKIGATTANADAAVRILMAWARGNKYVSGDSNMSLASGIYGYQLAQAAELMRDYEGWSREDFEEFKRYMMKTWYPVAVDFVRRRHDTWLNLRYANLGQRPGHYWSNWGLCNVLCLMSIGILCDDVHIYNQGVSFYKYDHVGSFKDRSNNTVLLNDGCNEFIGNLVPVVLPDERGPFGYLGQMQESGRDQGHSLMALGLAVDICQLGYNQGDDLFAYMDDRLAAGIEHVAALNFGGVSGSSLPWITYNYADCGGTPGAGWAQPAPNEGGIGQHRPYWDRIMAYYEGIRGVRLQYAEKARAAVGIDMGGGNYGQTSGGFDHLGFSTLTSCRPKIDSSQVAVVLSGDIVYKGDTLKNQTNLGGLKYKYEICSTKAVPADGADIRLIPRLPGSIQDQGRWQWNTGDTTRELSVKADRSYIYRVSYTAANGAQSEQAFAIAVAGDCQPDLTSPEITINEVVYQDTTAHILYGNSLLLYMGNSTGWTNDYYWDNGSKGNSLIAVPAITSDRTYTCQYINQGGYVNQRRFYLSVDLAQQYIIQGSARSEGKEARVLSGSSLSLQLVIPATGNPENILWQDGSRGSTYMLDSVVRDTLVSALYQDISYNYQIYVKEAVHSYYELLTTAKGYSLVSSADELTMLAPDCYFVLASDEADLLIGLKNAPLNGNKALFFQTPADPLTDASKVFCIEPYDNACCLRNIDYDGLLLQTELDRPDQLRTNDQPLPCEWTRLLLAYTDACWTVENGRYPGNFLGLWTTANGYRDGEELACNKTGGDIAKLQIFAIPKTRFHADYLAGASAGQPKEATRLMVNPSFGAGNGYGWTLSGSWGNQRYNGAAEVWHSTGFVISQTINGLPQGDYTLTCQMANGEGQNTGYLYASSGTESSQDLVTQSCAGSNFDAERNKMAANPDYGKLSVDIRLSEGSLSLGIKEPSDGSTWLVFDNFTLSYKGEASTAITKNPYSGSARQPSNEIYDLMGRKVPLPSRGIYIQNGKKYLVK